MRVPSGHGADWCVIRNFVPPCPEGTRIHQKPTASSEGAQLWDILSTLTWFREAGLTIILNIIRDASVPLRGTIWGGTIARTHSGAASQLAVGFMI